MMISPLRVNLGLDIRDLNEKIETISVQIDYRFMRISLLIRYGMT